MLSDMLSCLTTSKDNYKGEMDELDNRTKKSYTVHCTPPRSSWTWWIIHKSQLETKMIMLLPSKGFGHDIYNLKR